MSQRALSRAKLALLMALALSTSAESAPAAETTQPARVSIGDVSVAAGAAPELGRALRSALNDELSQLAGLGPIKRPLVLSARLTRLSSERRRRGAKATAIISLAVRRADDQVLFAELRGHASVEEATGNLASLCNAALHGAVRGALSRLPEVVQRSP